MKNFPHQINQLSRLTDAIGVFAKLIETNRDVDDDGIVGEALARAGVYTFRTPGRRTVDELLEIEHRKSPANQGTRTCARELRRFFGSLGFIRQARNRSWEISQPAKSLLALNQPENRAAANDIWRQALLGMELTDASGSSHPYQILLRLVVAMPGLPKPYSGLCLEARNDSDSEFNRIRLIAARPNPSDTMNALAGTYMAKNSVKILPSIAEQLGDVHDRNRRLYVSGQIADSLAVGEEQEASEPAIQRLIRRPYAPRRREEGRQMREQGAAQLAVRFYDPDRVGARFNAHEECIDRLSRLFPPEVDRLQATYDLLLVAPRTVMLVEAKTIRNDARRQIRLALGQLFYYEHFDVIPLHPDKEVLRLALTDCWLEEDLQKFLSKHQIGVVWISANGRVGGTQLGMAHLRTMRARL